MGNENTEIEIKIPLDEKTFLETREKLKKISKFIKTTPQLDKYYTPLHRNFVEPKHPFEWLSIRRRGDKNLLNYKHWYPENSLEATHADEFEIKVKDPEKLEKIFSALDFKELVAVEKEREVYVYNDELEVVLDSVKELGRFIEIEVETIKDFVSVEAARKRIFGFAKELGIDMAKTVTKGGYAFLLMEKKGLLRAQKNSYAQRIVSPNPER